MSKESSITWICIFYPIEAIYPNLIVGTNLELKGKLILAYFKSFSTNSSLHITESKEVCKILLQIENWPSKGCIFFYKYSNTP